MDSGATSNDRKKYKVLYRLARRLGEKIVVWFGIFIVLWLCSFIAQNIALAVLAVPLSQMAIRLVWQFFPKRTVSKLSEKAVLITGCDSGFGWCLAQRLDKKGLTVYAGCLLPDGDGAAQLRKNCSDRLRILQLDVTKDYHVYDAVNAVTSTLEDKKLWAVVNNAGIGNGGEIEWTPVDVCRRVLEVNTIGPYRITQAFLPFLRKSKGRIVMVTSVLGRITTAGTAPYSMSKHALTSLSDGLRQEMMKWNVSVHSIEPWMYSTKISEESAITQYMKENWEGTPQNVRNDYGESYLGEIQTSTKKLLMFKRGEDKCREVVDAMEHAVIGKNPKIRYVPGLVGQIWSTLMHVLPVEVFDLVCYFISPRKVNTMQ